MRSVGLLVSLWSFFGFHSVSVTVCPCSQVCVHARTSACLMPRACLQSSWGLFVFSWYPAGRGRGAVPTEVASRRHPRANDTGESLGFCVQALGFIPSAVRLKAFFFVYSKVDRLPRAMWPLTCMQEQRGTLSGQARLANAALEGVHVLAMHAADVQLQQGLYNPNLESSEGAEALFVATPQADSLQQVYVHLAQVRRAAYSMR